MKPRIVFVHGNDTMHWSQSWTAWMKAELDTLGYPTFFETMPDSILARSKYWLPFLQDIATVGAHDVLVGWSSGAVAAMRYAETHTVGGLVLVSPCYTDLDDDPYIPQSEFAHIAEHLAPVQIKITGGKHFIERDTFPELRTYIKQSY
jgi:uncharacterized protein